MKIFMYSLRKTKGILVIQSMTGYGKATAERPIRKCMGNQIAQY